MTEFASFSFQRNKASIVCTHGWNGHPVLLYAHDNDGEIQFYCGEDNLSMSEALRLGPAEINDL